MRRPFYHTEKLLYVIEGLYFLPQERFLNSEYQFSI